MLQCLALYIGALCHDLDHRGKNNKFMLDTESPLAAIYSTSTMEHHHFNQTVTILQQAIAMTASDLSASSKPWDIQVETVKVIFEEFYQQGDAERAAGRIPIPMMDRNQPDQQPSSQVGFLTGICVPCYTLLDSLIP
ncbi:hypothetical protein NQ317_015240 [Molorchus minor]|uniref:PDEase domain-containing protein n=1 Tax=Molorchus minor TaxID=1323400 RepID=A0ABQ9JQ81_9CUCU|nr:hypothetical protein NQ317_015240 [Molorchus minor]